MPYSSLQEEREQRLPAFTKMVKYTRQITAANFNGTIVKSCNQTISKALNDYW